MILHLETFLGGGNDGRVWSTDCGRVVKMIRPMEAVVAHHIRTLREAGTALPHLPEILAIFRAEPGYGILRTDIPDLPPLSEAEEAVFETFDHGLSCGDAQSLKIAVAARPQFIGVLEDLISLSRASGITILDLADSGNFGEVDGRLVIRDIGTAFGVRRSMVADIRLDDVRATQKPRPESDGPGM